MGRVKIVLPTTYPLPKIAKSYLRKIIKIEIDFYQNNRGGEVVEEQVETGSVGCLMLVNGHLVMVDLKK